MTDLESVELAVRRLKSNYAPEGEWSRFLEALANELAKVGKDAPQKKVLDWGPR